MQNTLRFLIIILIGHAIPAWGQAFGELDINNVRARFYANGLISMDPSSDSPNFEVPIGGGAHSLYSAGLWIGGLSSSGQLKLAAMMYGGDGSDWYTGPLSNIDASITEETMLAYDRVWRVNTADVVLHQAYCNCLATPGCNAAVEFPGYVMPAYFSEWPAMGDVTQGQDLYLAPFTDANADGEYDPLDCDAPCAPGDQSLYFIFNDSGDHLGSFGQPIGVEVQARPFAYAGPTEALSNTVFVEYRIINQGHQTLTDAYLALFTDMDLGCADDDYMGCDVSRSLWYAYNGDANDQDCLGLTGYGPAPPAFGATMLCGPFQDADGIDNPLVADHTVATNNLGSMYPDWGLGYGDQIVDNERIGLTRFMAWSGSGPATDPTSADQYYNRMRGLWSDGYSLTYGGTGVGGTDQARFAFPNDSDPLGQGTNGIVQPPWSEPSAGNVPADRRGLGSMGPFTLEPGAINRVIVAFVYARSNSGDAMNSVAELQARVDSIRDFAHANDFCGGFREDIPCAGGFATSMPQIRARSEGAMLIAPSVAADRITIQLPAHMVGATIDVIDGLGRRVARRTTQGSVNVELDITDLARGSYAIIAERNTYRQIGRFVKE